MSLLTPERVPVKVYRWDDVGAPALDKTPNCMATIFKACLVTGYSDKDSAGWTMPYEDAAAGVKVFRPEVSPHTDFYLRLSSDTGREMQSKLYLDMTDAHTGNLKLQCETSYKYGASNTTGKWVLIATPRGFWFFNESSGFSSSPTVTSGSYFYCGDTAANTAGYRGLFMMHTGGSWGLGDADRYSILSGNSGGGSVIGVFYNAQNDTVINVHPRSLFDGSTSGAGTPVASPLFISLFNEIWLLPAMSPSIRSLSNYAEIYLDGQGYINHSTSSKAPNNIYVGTDYWWL